MIATAIRSRLAVARRRPAPLPWVAALMLLPCWAGADFEAGVVAYDRGDHATARREWLPLARAGDAAAQFSIAVLYSQGLGVEVDHAAAARWYRLAAEQDVVAAQFTLGVLYAQGLGLPRDAVESARWYGRAAAQGDADAQFALGLLYFRGVGLVRDHAQATAWFRRAAVQGLGVAQASLGLMYESGHGVAQNDVCAYAWYSFAAANGSVRAHEKRAALRTGMTPDQIAMAQARSVALSRMAECVTPDPAPPAQAALVGQVRTELARLGYDAGPVDGDPGEAIASAVRAFQRDLGLTPTGRISEELLMLMRTRTP